tara:strand:+ start:375 stop:2294 length:1920 start_codon:yes stop_codon:yes gene_type:complete
MTLGNFCRGLSAAIAVLLGSADDRNSCGATEPQSPAIVPLFDSRTKLQPPTTINTPEALITRVADRVRDRHAREPGAYDHYLGWYWEERTVAIELIDRVARGGSEIVVNITSLVPLNRPDFRCFFRGINTVAEYHHNIETRQVSDRRYTTTITFNSKTGKPLAKGDRMEFEFSPFLVQPRNGRKNYYGTAFLYVVGRGIVPWRAVGERQDSMPLPESAWVGGSTTLPYQYSSEPAQRFKQMAGNMSPANAQAFMLGRRLHHTDFGTGRHTEQPNPAFTAHVGQLGPRFVASSCVACHVNNGRSLATDVGVPLLQAVIRVAADAKGTPHPALGTAIQPGTVNGPPEASATISRFEESAGQFADGTRFTLRQPVYAFTGTAPKFYSVRLTPKLVGLGLLEAIPDSVITKAADPDDRDQDGISGRIQVVVDPETGQNRLGRFGHKAGQARLRHQIAAAFNSDMGVTSPVFPVAEGDATTGTTELSARELDQITRYVSTLGVNARRQLGDPVVRRGETLFATSGCAKCHTPRFQTGPHHPLAELRGQEIQPYTDLLLHDMGPGLADNLGEQRATGAEWRTPPLWSIGLTLGVSGGESYLHDGRARSLQEAILWHGGEAKSSRNAFMGFSARDRDAVIRFLKSL